MERAVKFDFTYKFGGQPYPFRFTYRHADRAVSPEWLEALPPLSRSGLSICVRDLILEIGADGGVVEAWGYFPSEAWHNRPGLTVPAAEAGRVFFQGSDSLTPGVSTRIPGTESWQSFAIVGTNWIQFSSAPDAKSDIHVRIASGFICGLASGQIVGLWLLVEGNRG
jgi:hypothetical protein